MHPQNQTQQTREALYREHTKQIHSRPLYSDREPAQTGYHYQRPDYFGPSLTAHGGHY